MMRLTAVVATLLLPTLVASTEPSPVMPRVGDTYEIRRERESSTQTDGESTGSSTDRDAIIERVIGLREDGLELEYDLPTGATAEDRAATWQLPARVFKPFHGPMQLLNRAELAARVDGWLRAAGWPRTVCGHWIFTWNAFRIDCDPESVIETVESFDLGPADLRDGAMFEDSHARAPASVRRTSAGLDGATFVVELSVNPDAVRRDRAHADVVVAEVFRRDLTFDAALRARAAEDVSGTITITLETDPAGRVRRRVELTRLQIRRTDGHLETQTVTQTMERRRVSRRAG